VFANNRGLSPSICFDLNAGGGQAAYAAALAAMVAGKHVSLEVLNVTGCAGWGTQLQSIWVYPN
jgi:hypothetical protein